MKRIGAFVIIILVMMLTTLSLLPHHHHRCSDSVVCMLPNDCEHEGKCAHSHGTPLSDRENCVLKLVDVSAINKAEKQTSQLLTSFPIFIVSSNHIEIYEELLCGRLMILLSEEINIEDYRMQSNLRAPPAFCL